MDEVEVEDETRIGMRWVGGCALRCREGREFRGVSLESRPGLDFSSTTSELLSCAAMAKYSELSELKFERNVGGR